MPPKRIEDDPVEQLAEAAVNIVFRQIARYVEVIAGQQRAILSEMIRNEFAGRRIAKGTTAHRMARNTAIRADHTAGISIAALAKRYCLSRSAIRRILKKAEHAHII